MENDYKLEKCGYAFLSHSHLTLLIKIKTERYGINKVALWNMTASKKGNTPVFLCDEDFKPIKAIKGSEVTIIESNRKGGPQRDISIKPSGSAEYVIFLSDFRRLVIRSRAEKARPIPVFIKVTKPNLHFSFAKYY